MDARCKLETSKRTGSNLDGLEDHPVVHVAFEDAEAYAKWSGKELPTKLNGNLQREVD
jgi:formylglycine-generating enzyme required for sulfatase activity